MTRAEARAVLLAVAAWEPRGTSIELVAEDRANLREQIAEALASVVGYDAERALSMVDALRMSGAIDEVRA